MTGQNGRGKLPFVRRYTTGEEIANAVSHGLGALFGVVATTILIVMSVLYGDPYKIVSSAIYGATLILLYVMSTLYHSFTNERVKSVFRIFDHCVIYLLIAGNYTPFTLIPLRGAGGWTLFGVIWAAAVLGIVLNAISIERFKVFSIICYMAMGWAVVFALRPLCAALSQAGLWLLVSGGLCYTIGMLFYALKKRYAHSVWHLFVLAGSVLHFVCILMDIIL